MGRTRKVKLNGNKDKFEALMIDYEQIRKSELVAMINPSSDEIASEHHMNSGYLSKYVQVNIYGVGLNELRQKGVNIKKLLTGAGCEDCLLFEIPIISPKRVLLEKDYNTLSRFDRVPNHFSDDNCIRETVSSTSKAVPRPINSLRSIKREISSSSRFSHLSFGSSGHNGGDDNSDFPRRSGRYQQRRRSRRDMFVLRTSSRNVTEVEDPDRLVNCSLSTIDANDTVHDVSTNSKSLGVNESSNISTRDGKAIGDILGCLQYTRKEECNKELVRTALGEDLNNTVLYEEMDAASCQLQSETVVANDTIINEEIDDADVIAQSSQRIIQYNNTSLQDEVMEEELEGIRTLVEAKEEQEEVDINGEEQDNSRSSAIAAEEMMETAHCHHSSVLDPVVDQSKNLLVLSTIQEKSLKDNIDNYDILQQSAEEIEENPGCLAELEGKSQEQRIYAFEDEDNSIVRVVESIVSRIPSMSSVQEEEEVESIQCGIGQLGENLEKFNKKMDNLSACEHNPAQVSQLEFQFYGNEQLQKSIAPDEERCISHILSSTFTSLVTLEEGAVEHGEIAKDREADIEDKTTDAVVNISRNAHEREYHNEEAQVSDISFIQSSSIDENEECENGEHAESLSDLEKTPESIRPCDSYSEEIIQNSNDLPIEPILVKQEVQEVKTLLFDHQSTHNYHEDNERNTIEVNRHNSVSYADSQPIQLTEDIDDYIEEDSFSSFHDCLESPVYSQISDIIQSKPAPMADFVSSTDYGNSTMKEVCHLLSQVIDTVEKNHMEHIQIEEQDEREKTGWNVECMVDYTNPICSQHIAKEVSNNYLAAAEELDMDAHEDPHETDRLTRQCDMEATDRALQSSIRTTSPEEYQQLTNDASIYELHPLQSMCFSSDPYVTTPQCLHDHMIPMNSIKTETEESPLLGYQWEANMGNLADSFDDGPEDMNGWDQEEEEEDRNEQRHQEEDAGLHQREREVPEQHSSILSREQTLLYHDDIDHARMNGRMNTSSVRGKTNTHSKIVKAEEEEEMMDILESVVVTTTDTISAGRRREQSPSEEMSIRKRTRGNRKRRAVSKPSSDNNANAQGGLVKKRKLRLMEKVDSSQSTFVQNRKFKCCFKDCNVSIHWQPRYGKSRLVDHVRSHWKASLQCQHCQYATHVIRNLRRHHIKNHDGIAFDATASTESSEELRELLELWKECFPELNEILEWQLNSYDWTPY